MKITFSLILIFLTLLSFGKGSNNEGDNQILNVVSLKGTVIDADTGETLVGVAIKLSGSNEKVYTDFDGSFEIKNLRPGKYNLSANYISYDHETLNKIDVNQNSIIKVKMTTESSGEFTFSYVKEPIM